MTLAGQRRGLWQLIVINTYLLFSPYSLVAARAPAGNETSAENDKTPHTFHHSERERENSVLRGGERRLPNPKCAPEENGVVDPVSGGVTEGELQSRSRPFRVSCRH